MRWSYGPPWGVALAAVMGAGARPRTWPLWGLALGASVFTFEIVLLPAIGATPPLSRWPPGQLEAELLNTMAFGTTAAVVLQTAPRGRRPAR